MKKTTFLICGKHAVTEAVKNPKRNVLKVFCDTGVCYVWDDAGVVQW